MSFAQPFSDYEILARVGAGAMGTVFKARQKRLDRIVALKVLRPSLARNTRYVDRLRREAHIVAQFNHPNIVTGLDLGEEGGYHFFVMEFVEGQALKDLLQQWGSFPAEQVLDVAIQVAQALDHALGKGVIHRDIKPGNILIEDATGRVKVTDLGLAKAQGDLSLTREGATVGTPQYISPEQARSPQNADIRSDLYSLGATLYHMATGRAPFRGESMAEVITKVLSERAQSAAELNPDLGDGLSLVIRKLMAKDPELRYQTPSALLEDLHRVRDNEAPDVDRRRLEAADRPRLSWSPGRRSWWVAAAVVGLMLAVGLGVFLGRTVWGGPAARPGVDGDGAERLDAARAAGPGQHLRELDAQLARTTDPSRRRELEARRRALIAAIEDAIVRRVDTALQPDPIGASPVGRWAAEPSHWNLDGQGLTTELVDPLLEPLGWSTARLPEDVDPVPLERLREAARSAVRERCSKLLVAFQNHLDAPSAAAVSAALRERDYVGARAAVASVVERFAETGDWPPLAALPSGMAQQIRDRVRQFETTWNERIGAEEELAASSIRREAEGFLGALEARQVAWLDAPGLVLDRLVALRAELRADHPPSSRFGHLVDPWPDLERRFDLVQERLEARQIELDYLEFRDRLALAYSVLVAEGDARRAAELMAHFEPEPDRDGAAAKMQREWEEHRAAVRASELVLDAVLTEVARRGPVQLRLRQRPGMPQSFAVRGAPGEWVVERQGTVREVVAPSEVVFSSWLEALAANGAEADPLGSLDAAVRRRGVAVWAGVSMDLSAESLGEVDPFVEAEIWPLLLRLRGDRDRFGPLHQSQALARLQVVRDRAMSDRGEVRLGLVQQLLQGVERARADYPWTPGSDGARVLGELESWAGTESVRLRRELSLAEAIPSAEVRVDDEGGVAVRWSPAGLLDSAAAPRQFHLIAGGAGDRLAPEPDAQRRGLGARMVVADPLADEDDVQVVWTVRLEPGAPTPLWIFECRGVAAVISCFGTERLLRAGLLPAADVRRPERIALELGRDVVHAMRGDLPSILPGAQYGIGLHVGPSDKRGSVRARLFLAGEPITPWVEVRSDGVADFLGVRAAAPVEIEGLELRSAQVR